MRVFILPFLFAVFIFSATNTLVAQMDYYYLDNYGGSQTDAFYAVDMIPGTENLVAVGQTRSSNGDVNGTTQSIIDAWVTKVSIGGYVYYCEPFGGNGDDVAQGVLAVSNSEIYVVGHSFSDEGFEIEDNHGGSDFWVIRMFGSTSAIDWTKNFGTSSNDGAMDIARLPNGNLVIAGYVYGYDDDVEEYNGGLSDMWVICIDDDGDLLWETTVGDWREERANTIAVSPEGNILVAGYAYDGDQKDVIVAMLNSDGDLQWLEDFGDPIGDDIANEVSYTAYGNWVVAGTSYSLNTNQYPNCTQLLENIMGLVYSNTGELTNIHCWGGGGEDVGNGVAVSSDGHIYVAGYTASQAGQIYEQLGGFSDAVLLQMNASAVIGTSFVYGGNASDFGNAVDVDGSHIVTVGSSSSSSDWIPENEGETDGFVMALDGTSTVQDLVNPYKTIFVNSLLQYCRLPVNAPSQFSIYDITGHVVLSGMVNSDYEVISTATLVPGCYVVTWDDGNFRSATFLVD